MHGMHDLPDVPSEQSFAFAWLGFLWQGSVLGYAGQNLLAGMPAENHSAPHQTIELNQR